MKTKVDIWFWLICLALVISFIFFGLAISSANNASDRQTQELIKLAQQNKKQSETNSRHIDCIKDLFAAYTRNPHPISQKEADRCRVSKSPTPSTSSPTSSPTPVSTPKSTAGQGTKKPKKAKPNPPKCTQILIVKVC